MNKGCVNCKNYPCSISEAVAELYGENDLKTWYCVSFEESNPRNWYCNKCVDEIMCFAKNVPGYATPKYCPFSRDLDPNWNQDAKKR